MLNIAPRSALIAGRIDWAPYVLGAVQAVMDGVQIERAVAGEVHGHDMSAGFSQGWVDVLDLNVVLAAPGTEERLNEAIARFRRGSGRFAYQGTYTAVSVDDPSRTIDLKDGYAENAASSYPSFNYLVTELITVE